MGEIWNESGMIGAEAQKRGHFFSCPWERPLGDNLDQIICSMNTIFAKVLPPYGLAAAVLVSQDAPRHYH